MKNGLISYKLCVQKDKNNNLKSRDLNYVNNLISVALVTTNMYSKLLIFRLLVANIDCEANLFLREWWSKISLYYIYNQKDELFLGQ